MMSPRYTDRDIETICAAAMAAQSAERSDAIGESLRANSDSAVEPGIRRSTGSELAAAITPDTNKRASLERCISITRLSQFAARTVAMDLMARQHIEACRKCRARLTALRQSAAAGFVPAILRRRSIWTALAAAAACVAALFALPRGSTSPRGPIAATVASYCNLGDVNCDGKLTETDMDAFQLALFDPDLFAISFPLCDGLCGADANCDGQVDDQDVEPFLFVFDGG